MQKLQYTVLEKGVIILDQGAEPLLQDLVEAQDFTTSFGVLS
jgi:hypothetical protein